MIKYPKTPRVKDFDLRKVRRCQAVVSEKLDGANAGVTIDDGVMQLQSRGHVLTGGPRERQFALFKSLCAKHEMWIRKTLKDKYLLFGEWMYAKHRCYYDNLPNFFITYDVFDKKEGKFLNTPRRKVILANSPFPEAPILYVGPIRQAGDFSKFIKQSAFRTLAWKERMIQKAANLGIHDPMEHTDNSNLMEGVYVKLEDENWVVDRFKLPREEFQKVRDSDLWDRGWVLPNLCG